MTDNNISVQNPLHSTNHCCCWNPSYPRSVQGSRSLNQHSRSIFTRKVCIVFWEWYSIRHCILILLNRTTKIDPLTWQGTLLLVRPVYLESVYISITHQTTWDVAKWRCNLPLSIKGATSFQRTVNREQRRISLVRTQFVIYQSLPISYRDPLTEKKENQPVLLCKSSRKKEATAKCYFPSYCNTNRSE